MGLKELSPDFVLDQAQQDSDGLLYKIWVQCIVNFYGFLFGFLQPRPNL